MQKLTKEFNKAVVKKGETFAIELPAVPSTGYKWDLQLKAGKASLIMMDYISNPAIPPMMAGSEYKQVFVFEAQESGAIEIEAQYKRPWENKPPLKLQSFNVTVK